MNVKYLPPSEIDAAVKFGESDITVVPRFFTASGPAVLGMLISANGRNEVLDRVVISVNGKGKITLTNRAKEVKPQCDQPATSDSKETKK